MKTEALLALVFEAYDTVPAPSRARLYSAAVRDLTDDQRATIARRVVLECPWLPSPAALRALAVEGRPTELAGEIEREARRVGTWGEPVLSPPAAALVTELGGWSRACATTRDQIERVGKQAGAQIQRAALAAPTKGALHE